MNKALDYFGQILMEKVRDQTITEWDRTFNGEMKGITAQKVRKALSGLNAEQIEVIRWLIPKIVDLSLHNLLWTLEQDESINVTVKTDSEKVSSIRDVSDGLAGELYTEEGWIMRFSKQRYEEL